MRNSASFDTFVLLQVITITVQSIMRCIIDKKYERAMDILRWFSDYFEFSNEGAYIKWIKEQGGWASWKRIISKYFFG